MPQDAAPSLSPFVVGRSLIGYARGRAPQRISSPPWFPAYANVVNFTLGILAIEWSGINLVDNHLVKRGRYDVQSFFTPDGIYGRIQWWACICYVITLAVQVPFLDQLFYAGPLVSSLGRRGHLVDRGFGVASLLYLAGGEALRRARRDLPAAIRWLRRLGSAEG